MYASNSIPEIKIAATSAGDMYNIGTAEMNGAVPSRLR